MATEDYDDMDEDMDISGYNEEDEDARGPLFWSMKLEPNSAQEIDQPVVLGYIVHVTNACFGVNVSKGSRTLVMVNLGESGDASKESPVCVLRQGQNENQSLDLLFNESATISLKGQKPSIVYLSGYIQPPVEEEDDDLMNPMLEDMDEAEIEAALKEQKKQQMALDDDEEDDEEEEEEEEEEPQLIQEEEVDEPPTKKQKTEKGSKSTKNGSNKPEGKKKRKSPTQKAIKSPQQKPAEKVALEDSKEDDMKKEKKEKKDKKEKKEKKGKKEKKKMLNMKGGIKYRDMKVGDGEQVQVGDKLSVYYVGQTEDKKVFDKTITGKGFEFNFGKSDVIKGWDVGMKGMRVGGKRKLIIPPKLGYGANGSEPSIPPNATLTFTIELKGKN